MLDRPRNILLWIHFAQSAHHEAFVAKVSCQNAWARKGSGFLEQKAENAVCIIRFEDTVNLSNTLPEKMSVD